MSKTLLALAALDYAPEKKLSRVAFLKASTVARRMSGVFIYRLHNNHLVNLQGETVELTFGGMQYLRNHAK